MRQLAILVLHLLATVARLAGPGGARSVIAESVLVKHQLLILNRSRKRSPNLRFSDRLVVDRLVVGLCTLLMRPGRMIRSAIVLKPSTLLSLHRALTQRKYRRFFSSTVPTKPGPKGPTEDVIAAVVDMKRRNPTWGCPRIAQQIALAFGIPITKDVVRRILAVRYLPAPGSAGPSWLTVLGHTTDSLWSLDLFRCESAAEDGKTYTGRANLAGYARENARSNTGTVNVRHFSYKASIEPSSSGASGRTLVTFATIGRPGQQATALNGGQYWDEFVKTAEGWRIQKRTFVPGARPNSAAAPPPSR